jgi:hypothetical protein
MERAVIFARLHQALLIPAAPGRYPTMYTALIMLFRFDHCGKDLFIV